MISVRTAWIFAMAAGLATTVFSAAPSLSELQQEWNTAFPTPASPAETTPAETPPETYAILDKDFLLLRPAELSPSCLSRSLDTIRGYSVPLRGAHAACVKIISTSWHGAGVVISPQGDILTSYHLVAGVPGASIITLEGRVFSVTNIMAYSIVHDLALLKIPAETPAYLNLAPDGNAPSQGDPLHIVGHPGETSWKLSNGTTLRHYREGNTQVLHFDSDIKPGNSGGPVVNEKGQLCAITACSAKLADGSTVKVGVDTGAIHEFLNAPRNPIAFTDLITLDKNRRMTEFLGTLYLVMEDWRQQWLTAMAAVRIGTDTTDKDPAAVKFKLSRPKQAGAISCNLFLLRTLIAQCAETKGLDPRLYKSMKATTASLDQLINSLALSASPQTRDQFKATVAAATLQRKESELLFGQGLDSLENLDRSLNPNASYARQPGKIKALRDLHLPAGCHVDSKAD